MERVISPELQVGAPWDIRVPFNKDVSQYTFKSQLKHRRGPVLAEWEIDDTHQTDAVVDPDDILQQPYILMHLDAAVTETFAGYSQLEADIKDTLTGRSFFEIEIPVIPAITGTDPAPDPPDSPGPSPYQLKSPKLDLLAALTIKAFGAHLLEFDNATDIRNYLEIVLGVGDDGDSQAHSTILDDLAALDPTTFGKDWLEAADAAAGIAALGLGSAAMRADAYFATQAGLTALAVLAQPRNTNLSSLAAATIPTYAINTILALSSRAALHAEAGGEVAVNITAAGGTVNLDWATADEWNILLNANTIFTFSNIATATKTINIIQGTGGSKTITWPVALRWFDGGTEPVLATPAGQDTCLSVWYNGALLRGALIGTNSV